MTHAAILSGKFSRYVVNDLDKKIVELFYNSVLGTMNDTRRVISRDEFHELKTSDPFYSLCWSFNFFQKTYAFSLESEDVNILIMRTIMSDDIHEREVCMMKLFKLLAEKYVELEEKKRRIEEFKKKHSDPEEYLRNELRDLLKKSGRSFAELERHLGTNGMAGHYFTKSQWAFPTREKYNQMREIIPMPEYDYYQDALLALTGTRKLEDVVGFQTIKSIRLVLQNIRRIERLKSLSEFLDKKDIKIYSTNYQDVPIDDKDGVIYCDIPYINTKGYKTTENGFDYDRFYKWCERQPLPVFISEYWMPEDRFICIAERKRVNPMSNIADYRVEKIFVPKHQKEMLKLGD
jgi:hypothetical protein